MKKASGNARLREWMVGLNAKVRERWENPGSIPTGLGESGGHEPEEPTENQAPASGSTQTATEGERRRRTGKRPYKNLKIDDLERLRDENLEDQIVLMALTDELRLRSSERASALFWVVIQDLKTLLRDEG